MRQRKKNIFLAGVAVEAVQRIDPTLGPPLAKQKITLKTQHTVKLEKGEICENLFHKIDEKYKLSGNFSWNTNGCCHVRVEMRRVVRIL